MAKTEYTWWNEFSAPVFTSFILKFQQVIAYSISNRITTAGFLFLFFSLSYTYITELGIISFAMKLCKKNIKIKNRSRDSILNTDNNHVSKNQVEIRKNRAGNCKCCFDPRNMGP